MTPCFYDTHAHLNYPDFAPEIEAVVERARQSGITRIVAIGTDESSSRRCLELSEQFPNVHAAVGWHPSDAGQAPADVRPLLRELAGHPGVVALGETGLDHYRLPSKHGQPVEADARYKARQLELFQQHLEVAAELGLNCVIHQRNCLEETLAAFEPFAARVRGVFHCFSDRPAVMERIVGLGSLVSFTGIVTFKNAADVRETVARTPAGKFMLETDAPYLAPVPFRGKRCEPAYVKQIAESVAAARGCGLPELSEMTCRAAEEFFHFRRRGGAPVAG
jgi:TatD DNase family protein